MREIKFRCFYELTKRMEYLHNSNWSDGSSPNIMYWDNGRCLIMEWEGGVGAETDSAIIMQYTGLKDKNGKEIYEGDIVKYWGGIHPIEYKGYGFAIKYTEEDYFDINTPDEVEVLGNIYENPELNAR